MFRWLSRPSGPADTANTWHSSIHQHRHRHGVELCRLKQAARCDVSAWLLRTWRFKRLPTVQGWAQSCLPYGKRAAELLHFFTARGG